MDGIWTLISMFPTTLELRRVSENFLPLVLLIDEGADAQSGTQLGLQ